MRCLTVVLPEENMHFVTSREYSTPPSLCCTHPLSPNSSSARLSLVPVCKVFVCYTTRCNEQPKVGLARRSCCCCCSPQSTLINHACFGNSCLSQQGAATILLLLYAAESGCCAEVCWDLPVLAMGACLARRRTPRAVHTSCHTLPMRHGQLALVIQLWGSRARSPSFSHFIGSSANSAPVCCSNTSCKKPQDAVRSVC